ncbi:MAG: double-strand break repair protein AddB [Acetobacteraceae bacterium]
MKLASVPAGAPFLDALAAHWLARAGEDPAAVGRGLILLPTRRAARALAEAFLRQTGGRPLLLPRLAAVGAPDEAPLLLAGALSLPPAIEPARRLALLARMILALGGRSGAPRHLDRAWPLAAELARLLDEAARTGADLATRLPEAADPAFAAHWQATLDFLAIVTRAWPAVLAEAGLSDPETLRVALLAAQAEAWERSPPAFPVVLAGVSGGLPALVRLARTIAGLPEGLVLLPPVDTAMDEALWQALPETHPQAGLSRLLAGLGARREEVAVWPARASATLAARARLLSRALLPAAGLGSWRAPDHPDLRGLALLECADAQEEAVAIALVLRGALERPGAQAALITPDRVLARRVALELARFGVIADDSAGEPLAETPPAVLLRLLARALAENLAPVALLALLKHPLAAAGLAPAACRSGARALERAVLRGPRPPGGLSGLRQALDRAVAPEAAEARALLARLEPALAPLLRLFASTLEPPRALLAGLIAAAEALAATADVPGTARLWSGEEGEALSAHLAAHLAALEDLPAEPPATLPLLLDALLEGVMVRTRRSLRGRTGAEHPRIFIWGLLEARLQSVDLAVLGGLVEGVWPAAADPGPWLNRVMRARVGLAMPEEAVGQAAADFVAAALAAPEVVLSLPRRRERAPAVPARWLTRLTTLLAGQGLALPSHPAVLWARALDQPAGPPQPVSPPRPCPPLALRPRRLAVTEVGTWLADPYAIHARHILRLEPLPPLEQTTDAADFGTLVHRAIHRFLAECGPAWPADGSERLARWMARTLAESYPRPALAAWWAPRLARIAAWIAAEELRRRAGGGPVALVPERRGEWRIPAPAGPFTLTGRADRIERRADGRLALLDYKTGAPPREAEVAAGRAPQLPLEAAMAAAGAFGPDLAGETAELTYWHLSGADPPGAATALFARELARLAAVVAEAAARFAALLARFDDPATPYLARPDPAFTDRFSPYARLARAAEWQAAPEPPE